MFPQLEKVKRTTELGLVVEHLERKNRKIKKEFATKLGRVEQSCKAGLKKLEIVDHILTLLNFSLSKLAYFYSKHYYYITTTSVLINQTI